MIDQVDYGSLSGLVATNAYVEENNLDSLHLRVPLKAIQREEISKPAIGFDPANFGTGDLEVQVEPVYNQDWFTSSHERRPGCKVYEMKNHLGNVLATVSDWKIGADTSVAGSVADYYLAQVRSLTDYLPFGMEMPGRVWSEVDYRYGFTHHFLFRVFVNVHFRGRKVMMSGVVVGTRYFLSIGCMIRGWGGF